MTSKMKTPVLAGTGAMECSAGRLNNCNHSQTGPEIHQILQMQRLRHRFGMPGHRARLVAFHAFGGRYHG